VYDNAETSKEQHEADGWQTVARRGRLCAVQHVETQRERQVGGHREPVGHGQSSEDAVGRRDHVVSSQHDDVQRVGDDAEHADDAGQVAVVVLVPVVEDGQLAATWIYVDVAGLRHRLCGDHRRCIGVSRRNVGVVIVVTPRHPPRLVTYQTLL